MAEGGSPDILSQTEVESILASLQPEAPVEQEISILAKGKSELRKASSVQLYDFRSPVYLNPSQMRRLRIKHEDYIRGLAASLSLYLRMEFGLQMSRLETISYRSLLDSLPMPSHLVLFKLKPLNGVCLYEMAPRLGLTVIDRMMGGPGHSVKEEREFTDIEIGVLSNFIQLVLKEYAESWLKYKPLTHEVMQHENTARFLNIVRPDEIMLYLEMEARFGDCVAGMRFIIPYSTIEGLVIELMKEVSSDSASLEAKARSPQTWDATFYNIPVPISAHWRGHSLTLREVQNLSVGDLLLLDPKVCERAIVDLGALPKFLGKISRDSGQVKLTILSRSE
ncbi:MAG: flagellar motor switch protein FliM [Verrucomicrobiota bacterium]